MPEVAPKSSEPEVEEFASVVMDRTLNLTKSGVPLDDDDTQSKVCLTKLEDDSSLTASPCLTGRSSAVSFNDLNRHVSLSAFPPYVFAPC